MFASLLAFVGACKDSSEEANIKVFKMTSHTQHTHTRSKYTSDISHSCYPRLSFGHEHTFGHERPCTHSKYYLYIYIYMYITHTLTQHRISTCEVTTFYTLDPSSLFFTQNRDKVQRKQKEEAQLTITSTTFSWRLPIQQRKNSFPDSTSADKAVSERICS